MKLQAKNIPSLRFAEYKEPWVTYRLADVCSRIMDGTHFSPKSKDGERKYITSKNIKNEGLDLAEVQHISEAEHRVIFARTPIKCGDILLTKDGASTGNCCLNTLDEEFSLLSSVAVLRTLDESYNNIFLLQNLQSAYGSRAIQNAIAGQAITRITLDKIKSLHLKFPLLPEQQKIAAFLSELDKKIGLLSKKKELLLKYKSGVMQQLFDQQIRFKARNGNKYLGWELRPFEELFVSMPTKRFQILSSDIASRGRFPVIDQGQDLVAGYSDDASKLFKDLPVVVFGDHTAILKFIDFNFVIGADGTKVLKPATGDSKFLYYALVIHNISTEGYKRHFSILKSVKLLIPKSVNEQIRIATFLSKIEERIEILDRELELTRTFKKGLLQKMFV
jgi:type I restriction enzyme S subunit